MSAASSPSIRATVTQAWLLDVIPWIARISGARSLGAPILKTASGPPTTGTSDLVANPDLPRARGHHPEQPAGKQQGAQDPSERRCADPHVLQPRRED